MVPSSYHDFFLAMSSAGAALIGLLFVAVSINAERIVGPHAMPERQGVATSTLTALANGFAISSWLLIPGHGAGPVTMVMALISFFESAALGVRLGRHQVARHRRRRHVVRVMGYAVVSMGLYAYEFVLGRRLAVSPLATGVLSSLAGVVLIVYMLGLFRAWTLLGASRRGPGAWLNPLQDLDETAADEVSRKAA